MIPPKRKVRKSRERRPPGDNLAYERLLELDKAGLTQGDLATRWGKRQPFVSNLLRGHVRSLELERAFAELVGRPYDELWPEPTEHQRALERGREEE